MSTTAHSNKSLYHPTKWPGFNRASSAEMTAFGILGLINFIACGALLLTHLWCRNTLDVPRKIRRRLRSLKRTNLDQKETDDDDDWFAPELQADRSTLNLLAVSCLSTPPWILLYLDSAVAYSTKPPAYGVCLVQGSFVMGWAVFMAAGAFGVVMSKSNYPPPRRVCMTSLIDPDLSRRDLAPHNQAELELDAVCNATLVRNSGTSLVRYSHNSAHPVYAMQLLALPWILLAIFFFSALAVSAIPRPPLVCLIS